MKRKYLPNEFEDYVKSHNFEKIYWNTEDQIGTQAYDFNHIVMRFKFTSFKFFYLPTCLVLFDSETKNQLTIHNFEYAVHKASSRFGELFEITYRIASEEDTCHHVNIVLK